MIHTCSYKQFANSEAYNTNDVNPGFDKYSDNTLSNFPSFVFVFVTNIIDWYGVHTASNWQIEARNGKNVAENNKFHQKNLAEERIHKRDQQKPFSKKTPFSKKEDKIEEDTRLKTR